MRKNLVLQALTKYIAGLVFVGLMVFLPAGSMTYFNGWLFMALLFIPMLLLGIVLFIKSPELLEKRLNSKEKLGEQKRVIGASGVIFLLGANTLSRKLGERGLW